MQPLIYLCGCIFSFEYGTSLESSQQVIGPCARRKTKQTQTNALMCVDEDDNVISMMEAALEEASPEMVALVKRRNQALKVRIVCHD